ncbi:hypothetical protein D3C76_1571600 [compost metagenome]
MAANAAGPASKPTTAPKAVKPNSENAHCAAGGNAPTSGWRELYQPINSAATNTPPPMPSSTGIIPTCVDNNPSNEPKTIPSVCTAISLL